MAFKQKVYAHCLALVENKIASLHKILADLEEGSANDSKSSAGDKHETARAMMQIEQEKIGRQARDLYLQKTLLEKNSSLIKTNRGYLFLSIPLGKIEVESTPVTVISPQSPLGKKIFGLKVGDKTEINDVSYTIEEIQ